MQMKRKAKYVFGMLTAAVMLAGLGGCGSGDAEQMPETEQMEEAEQISGTEQMKEQPAGEAKESNGAEEINKNDGIIDGGSSEQTDADGNLDQIAPDPADDNWYMKGNIYKGDNGHYAEVFFDDEGMLEFAVDGLSLYDSSVDKVQYENDWRIYACDDGVTVVYYPGEPAHLEIYGGDYEGIYEEGGDKMK